MRKIKNCILFLILAVLFLSGCMPSVDEMYAPPKHVDGSPASIEEAMRSLDYAVPLSGSDNQAVHETDLDGDGTSEYIVFAKGHAEKTLAVLVFAETKGVYELKQTVEVDGVSFEMIRLVDLDGNGCVEIVVGTGLTDRIQNKCTAYTFSSELEPKELFAIMYSKLQIVDLDDNGLHDLVILKPGRTDGGNGVAICVTVDQDHRINISEAELTVPYDQFRQIASGVVAGKASAVFVTSLTDDAVLTTDVFAFADGELKNVSYREELGTSIVSVHSTFAYPQDVNGDGVTELPYLMPMMPMDDMVSVDGQELTRWYALNLDGEEMTATYTFHNYLDGWYMTLDDSWATFLTVVNKKDEFLFYVWNETYENAQIVMRLKAGAELGPPDTEAAAVVVGDQAEFQVVLEEAAVDHGITEEFVKDNFHMILS